jgi:hypothetical protein
MNDPWRERPLAMMAMLGLFVAVIAFFVGITFHLGWSIVG